jgi:hypothetical protein
MWAVSSVIFNYYERTLDARYDPVVDMKRFINQLIATARLADRHTF